MNWRIYFSKIALELSLRKSIIENFYFLYFVQFVTFYDLISADNAYKPDLGADFIENFIACLFAIPFFGVAAALSISSLYLLCKKKSSRA